MQAFKIIVVGSNDTVRTAFIKAVSEAGVVSTPGAVTPQGLSPDMQIGRRTFGDEVALYLFGVAGDDLDALAPSTFTEGTVGSIVLADGMHSEAIDAARDAIAFMMEHSDAPFAVAFRGLREQDPGQVTKLRGDLGLGQSTPLLALDSTERAQVKRVLEALVAHAGRSAEVADR